MATAPQPQLPLFYKDLLPLNSRDHGAFKVKSFEDASFLASTHAIPLTCDEFVDAARCYPIVFTAGENPLPIALMGLNEGVNVFVDADNKFETGNYAPAYVSRYPFILAKLQQDSEEMSLCFDPQAGVVGLSDEGQALFRAPTDEDKAKYEENGQQLPDKVPTEYTDGVLEFCRRFEEAGQRTKEFMEQLKQLDLLRDGRFDITRNDMPDKPFSYTGFQMVNEEKLRELDGATLETLNKNGMMMLMHAQLFSLRVMRNIFEKQNAMGKIPEPNAG
ncbi:MAG: SapC family protein [Pseudomonadota bacterium]